MKADLILKKDKEYMAGNTEKLASYYLFFAVFFFFALYFWQVLAIKRLTEAAAS